MVTGLRALSDWYRGSGECKLLDDAANYIEGTTENLRQQAEQLIAMRVKLEQVRPLMEQAANTLEDLIIEFIPIAKERRRINQEMELTNAMRALLRWWEPGTAEPASISHWGIVE
jgi:predicted subunit of tRNA(5-methylaminomethyl-2-thiouridylate) methyltransferase